MVQNISTDQLFAMKYLNKASCVEQDFVENVGREISILQRLKHDYIVNLWYTFQVCLHILFQMTEVWEYPGNELCLIEECFSRLTEALSLGKCESIGLGLGYCQGFAHCLHG